jgi:hypothetical protein
MKALALAFVCGMAAWAGGAAAQVFVPNIAWKAAPTRAEVEAAFPKGQIGRTRSTIMDLWCQLKLDGTLEGCNVGGPDDWKNDFARAAYSLESRFVAYVPADLTKVKDKLTVNVLIDFHDPSRPEAPEINPEWVQLTGAAPPSDPFPIAAAQAGYESGMAVLECEGAKNGGLTNCAVLEETPQGMGFGQSALVIAQSARLNRWQEGEPVEGARLRVPIYVHAPAAATEAMLMREAVFHVPGGYEASGPVGPYYPDRAWRMGVKGSVLLECVISASGALSHCVPEAESPIGFGFADATFKMLTKGAITAPPRPESVPPNAPAVSWVHVPFTPRPR